MTSKIFLPLLFITATGFSLNAMDVATQTDNPQHQKIVLEFNLENSDGPTIRKLPIQEIVDYITKKAISAEDITPAQQEELQKTAALLLEEKNFEHYTLLENFSDKERIAYGLSRLLEATQKGIEGSVILTIVGGKIVIVTTYHILCSIGSFLTNHTIRFFTKKAQKHEVETETDAVES